MPTVAGIIIGNEILSGKFADANGPFLIRRCRALGADLQRLVTIPDTPQAIAGEVALCSARYDLVVTSGGVGPTHDDLTLDNVAAGLGVGTHPHPELVSLLEQAGLTDRHALRMATVPAGTELIWPEGARFPVMRCQNVIVLPGVPKLFQHKFEQVSRLFAGVVVHAQRIYTDEAETSIAGRLAEAQERFASVDIGSYPRFDEGPYSVIVTLESRDAHAVGQAVAWLSERLRVVDPRAEGMP